VHHYSQGKPTRQAHKGIPESYYEEEQGLKGFFGPVSHLIRKKPSTRWSKIEGDLKPRLFDLVELNKSYEWQRLLYNNFLTISVSKVAKGISKKAFRNADGDTIYFCHSGSGNILTEYGLLDYKKGSYIVIPKCITHQFSVDEDSNFFIIENKSSHFEDFDRGIAGRHAIFDIETIGKPDLDKLNKLVSQKNISCIEIEVKHNNKMTNFSYDETIYDVVGWKGDLFPYTLNTENMMPLMSHRAHLPPSAHTTFVARDFVVCTFLPRPLEEDEDALKVPFYHQNIDYDEVLFYHDGNFFSRDNLHAGMMTFHPAGFPHGPHPKAVNSIKGKTKTDETAVMVDSRWPLQRDSILDSVELKEYWQSWKS